MVEVSVRQEGRRFCRLFVGTPTYRGRFVGLGCGMEFGNPVSFMVTCLALSLGVAAVAAFLCIMVFEDTTRIRQRELAEKLKEVVASKRKAREERMKESYPKAAKMIEKMAPDKVKDAITATIAADAKK